MRRPAVSVIVPFSGTREQAAGLVEALGRVELRRGDEIVLADNSPTSAAVATAGGETLAVVPAAGEASSYFARNTGAAASSRNWLLFTDADCVVDPSILDEYFREPLPDSCGAVAGGIRAAPDQTALLARWARWRAILDQRHGTGHPYRPFGSTANLLVRRAAFEAAGGFCEGIRSGGDADLCWRLQELGWTLEERPAAFVEHTHRERLGPLLRQATRYGRGRAWLERRFPDCPAPAAVARGIARSIAAVPYHALHARRERAMFRAIDALFALAMTLARALPNRPPGGRAIERAAITVLVDRFPSQATAVPDEPGVRVEAAGRARQVDAAAVRGRALAYAEDDAALDRVLALAWLLLRRPVRVLHALASGRGLAEAPVAARAMRARGDLDPRDEAGAETARAITVLTGMRATIRS